MSLLITGNAARLTMRLRDRAQRTKSRFFFEDVYEFWSVDRPVGAWDRGEEDERRVLRGSGVGRLYANGVGGPATSEGFVYPESPYRLRVAATFADALQRDEHGAPELTGAWLVLNRQRLFQIEAFKVEDADDRLADLYLKELLNKPLPQVVAEEPMP